MFSIDTFAANCKAVMATADNPQAAVAELMSDAIATYGPDDIITALTEAVPPDASIGELIVHASPELTLLFARIPARFQSGIHNHTVFACIGQLKGREVNTTYEPSPDGLTVIERQVAEPGIILQLPEDAIHGIANPDDETAYALHLYGGDFGAIQDERSLWDHDTHEELGFSFPALVDQSVKTMKQTGNEAGIEALVRAIPSAKAALS